VDGRGVTLRHALVPGADHVVPLQGAWRHAGHRRSHSHGRRPFLSPPMPHIRSLGPCHPCVATCGLWGYSATHCRAGLPFLRPGRTEAGLPGRHRGQAQHPVPLRRAAHPSRGLLPAVVGPFRRPRLPAAGGIHASRAPRGQDVRREGSLPRHGRPEGECAEGASVTAPLVGQRF
jgi:hypothetical protein